MRESLFPAVFPIEVADERGGTTQELQRGVAGVRVCGHAFAVLPGESVAWSVQYLQRFTSFLDKKSATLTPCNT